MSPSHPGSRPVCMLVHAYYEEDSRVRREAETLVRSGRPVDVFALRRRGQPAVDEIDGVRLVRLPVQRHQGAGIAAYLFEYVEFMLRAGLAASLAHRKRRYALLQVHSLPDFLIAAGLPLRLAAGVPLLLDLHEAMPEFYRVRFPRRGGRLALRLMELQERASIAAASAVLTVNAALADRLVVMGVEPTKITVILNAPDLRRFDPSGTPRRDLMADGTLRLVYAGALTPTYEVDVAIRAMADLTMRRQGLHVTLDVYGRGDSEPSLHALARSLSLADRVRFHGRIPLEDVPARIAAADIGLATTRRTAYTEVSLSTKLFEYGAMLKPVVATSLPTVHRYFGSDTVLLYDAGDPVSLATRLLEIVDDPENAAARVARTADRLAQIGWPVQAARYVDVIERTAVDGTWRQRHRRCARDAAR